MSFSARKAFYLAFCKTTKMYARSLKDLLQIFGGLLSFGTPFRVQKHSKLPILQISRKRPLTDLLGS